MIALSSLVVAILFAAGLYLMLSRNTQRVVIGFIIMSNGVNMMVLTASGAPEAAVAPLIEDTTTGPYMDPLPQAFILTAIVIGLGVSAFLLAMAARTHGETGSDRLGLPEEG